MTNEERSAIILKAIAAERAGIELTPEFQKEVSEARRSVSESIKQSVKAMNHWFKALEHESQIGRLPEDKHALIKDWLLHAQTLPETDRRFVTLWLTEARTLLEPFNESEFRMRLIRVQKIFEAASHERLTNDHQKNQLTQEKRSAPLIELNKAKAAAKQKCQSFAKEKWQCDAKEEIKISEMTEMAWAFLIDEGFSNALPENRSSLKDWISPVAPSYARVGGRPKTK